MKNTRLMRVHNEFDKVAKEFAARNKITITEATREIAKTTRKLNGRKFKKIMEIKF